jgi:acyl carrier protein
VDKVNLKYMKSIFEESIQLDSSYDLSLESMFEEVPGWDSIGHMLIITALEENLDIELEIEEIIGVNTVQKLINIAASKL